MSEEKDFLIAALEESIEGLRAEITQVRNSNRILRRVHSALRSSIVSMRVQVAIAQQNDELFKDLCNGYDAKVTSPVEGGLLTPGTQVNSLV